LSQSGRTLNSESDNSPASSTAAARAAVEAYPGASGRAYHEVKRGVHPAALKWIQAMRAEKFRPHVAPNHLVLEFGVGAGWNLAMLPCRRRIGCDAAEFLAPELERMGIEFVPELAAVPASSVDVVLCHHALEHVLHPARTLMDLQRVLVPGGKLVLHVPWERERRYARYRPDEPNHHLHGWCAQTLGHLATVVGWKVESVTTRRYGYDRFAANLAHRLHLGGAGFRALRSGLIALRPLREVELIARRA